MILAKERKKRAYPGDIAFHTLTYGGYTSSDVDHN